MYALGGVLTAQVVTPGLNKVGAGAVLANPMGKRIVGGMVPVTLGYCLLVRWLAFKLLDRWFR